MSIREVCESCCPCLFRDKLVEEQVEMVEEQRPEDPKLLRKELERDAGTAGSNSDDSWVVVDLGEA